ncbi:MAG: S-methyl-5'-thioadenosine phosphorylase [Nitrospirae bacterium]|nr:S-methyl-5'-thioadenosine phosphorylase [Nitrospirota bacterium]MBI3593325.1 S-methyl-5'-thioadenosine phosphorylase [Nitrospirota bacterium]
MERKKGKALAIGKSNVKLGVIGGSGLYDMEGMTGIKKITLKTPFGSPSGPYVTGNLEGQRVAFLARHGEGHKWLPSEINYRANIFGMKMLGVERIISVSAVGSMKEVIEPGHLVIPDQFFDHTKQRRSTFFGEGVVAHVSFAHPICPELSKSLFHAGQQIGAQIHWGGTYLCMEGPQFSSKAESLIYRKWGVDIIGMTNVTEAKLSREAEICYSTIALATDYDCWHEEEAHVNVESVIKILNQNVVLSKNLIRKAIPGLDRERKCTCVTALKNAIITSKKKITVHLKKKLNPLIQKYL